MNITSAKYYKGISDDDLFVKAIIKIGNDEEETHIPTDPNNRHWQAIQAWVADGNTIDSAD